MERYTYPHTIENGAGEGITFLRKVPSDAGDRLEIENVVTPGSGPPTHIHHYQEEADGRLWPHRLPATRRAAAVRRAGRHGHVQSGGAPQILEPGRGRPAMLAIRRAGRQRRVLPHPAL